MGKKDIFTYKLVKCSELENKLHKLGCDLRQQGLKTEDILANAIGLLAKEITKIKKIIKAV